ncbi:MAG: hypothetical protein ACRDJC_22730 [Thermomicrobiales bacterium]
MSNVRYLHVRSAPGCDAIGRFFADAGLPSDDILVGSRGSGPFQLRGVVEAATVEDVVVGAAYSTAACGDGLAIALEHGAAVAREFVSRVQWLRCLYVNPRFQRLGIGSTLLERQIITLRTTHAGPSTLAGAVPPLTARFWAKSGFTVVSGRDSLPMRLPAAGHTVLMPAQTDRNLVAIEI